MSAVESLKDIKFVKKSINIIYFGQKNLKKRLKNLILLQMIFLLIFIFKF